MFHISIHIVCTNWKSYFCTFFIVCLFSRYWFLNKTLENVLIVSTSLPGEYTWKIRFRLVWLGMYTTSLVLGQVNFVAGYSLQIWRLGCPPLTEEPWNYFEQVSQSLIDGDVPGILEIFSNMFHFYSQKCSPNFMQKIMMLRHQHYNILLKWSSNLYELHCTKT